MKGSGWSLDCATAIGRCPDCGKLAYLTRTVAKRAIRQFRRRGVLLTRVYQCGDWWHVTSQDTATTTAHRSQRDVPDSP